MQKRCSELGFALEGDELIEVYRALMSIADDRKTLTDTDIRAVVVAMSEEHVVTVHATHEAGYGHGV